MSPSSAATRAVIFSGCVGRLSSDFPWLSCYHALGPHARGILRPPGMVRIPYTVTSDLSRRTVLAIVILESICPLSTSETTSVGIQIWVKTFAHWGLSRLVSSAEVFVQVASTRGRRIARIPCGRFSTLSGWWPPKQIRPASMSACYFTAIVRQRYDSGRRHLTARDFRIQWRTWGCFLPSRGTMSLFKQSQTFRPGDSRNAPTFPSSPSD